MWTYCFIHWMSQWKRWSKRQSCTLVLWLFCHEGLSWNLNANDLSFMLICGLLGPGIVCLFLYCVALILCHSHEFRLIIVLKFFFFSQSLISYSMQPMGFYAKISHMISKIIAHVLGDSTKKVILPKRQRGCDVYSFRWIGCSSFLSITLAAFCPMSPMCDLLMCPLPDSIF